MAVDAYLELFAVSGKVKGEATDETFKESIEIKFFELSGRSISDVKADAEEEEEEGDKKDDKAKKPKPKKVKAAEGGSFTVKIKKDADASSLDLVRSYCENLGEEAK